jgi:predicted RNase H-like nuclease (RuvC/YqgF family)
MDAKLDLLIAGQSKILSNHEILKGEVEDLKTTVEQHEKTISSLTRQNEKLMDEVRRTNLIIHGIDEGERTTDDLASKILDLFGAVGLNVQIDNPYRLGKPISGKIRPVKVRLPLMSHRYAVLSSKSKLRALQPSVGVSEDLTPATREERKRAWDERSKTGAQPRHTHP